MFSIYAFLRFNTSFRQLQLEIDVQYKTIYQRVERFTKALDAPSLDLVGPVEIDEVYVSAELKGRERDRPSRSRGLSTRGRGSYDQDKPPVFMIIDRGTGDRYVIPAKSDDEPTIRLLLANREKEPLTVYTDGFRAYDPLNEDDAFDREYVVRDDDEYADENVHANTCESHGSLLRPWFSPHRGISKDKLTQYLRAFQLRRKLLRRPGREVLKRAIKATLCIRSSLVTG
ncbi:Insertion element protein [Natrialba taiwanensis DSM 12281]|uniref:Insertion element protein n=1 Tax=Natrialba taiwanensis DSM 12281 TaxID=1230458 RepID=M0A8P3_9EURY|nr:Insertion element protein [Natrialba taiwanensis DSM 12281]